MAEMVADVDGEPNPRRSANAQRPRSLRDISHLYLSNRPVERPSDAVPAVRRALRIGFVSAGDGLIRSDVCGNFAVQLARLGQRTTVLDLDPLLPNAGFLLGLGPAAYGAHLCHAEPVVERALLGLRVIEGIAARRDLESCMLLKAEIATSDCILVNLPDVARGAEAVLDQLRPLLATAAETTMVQAAARSRMFGAWLDTSRRHPASSHGSGAHPLDALVFVHSSDAAHVTASYETLVPWLRPGRVHRLGWGIPLAATEPRPWAWIEAYDSIASGTAPLSSLYPEHPASRTYQGLAQALLAGLGSAAPVKGGTHV
ncbi:MAG TPA: hypothetical protein VFD07_06530 [Candidatus Krumholzibacteria bacterium]|nr:hypothetical protein [Candidatus Krumholzibacteria bacterium]